MANAQLDNNSGASAQESPPTVFAIVREWLWLIASLFLLAVFLIDVLTPTHLVIPIGYIVGLVMIIALPKEREKIFVASVCTIITIIDFHQATVAPNASYWLAIFSYALALMIIWFVTVLSLRHSRSRDALQESEKTAKEHLAQLNIVYASAPVGLAFVDRELRYVSINDALATMNGISRETHIGKTLREAIPHLAHTVEKNFQQALATGAPVIDVEVRGTTPAYPKEPRYFLSSYYPVKDEKGTILGINLAVRDVTESKQAESDTLFLLDLGEHIRLAEDPDELLWTVAVALGEYLNVARCAFIETDIEADSFTVHRDYHAHLPSVLGHYTHRAFGDVLGDETNLPHAIVIENVVTDARTSSAVINYRQMSVEAFTLAPLLRDGRKVAALIVAARTPYAWSEREVALVVAVAERTWLAVEKLRLHGALLEREEALHAADRRKDEFLATLAHELRNPLALIRNIVSLQQAPDLPAADLRWGRDIIDRQVGYLTRLTDDLFDISRITRDKFDLQKEDVELGMILSAAAEASRPLIDQRGHTLIVNLAPAPIYLEGDRVRLIQVFMNLLNNAAKYSPDPGHITLSVERTPNQAVVRVKDTGMGIAAENLPHVFDLFYQVDRSFTRTEGGLGLGLTLVHRLVTMHKGTVEVYSDGVNRGSEFTVHLPLLMELTSAEQVPVHDDFADEPQSRGLRILVADDFPESAAILARLLGQDGYDVRTAENGLEAIETAATFQPDVVLLDLAMPKLNGFEAAEKIREQPWGQKALLVALTGWGQKQDRQRTQAAGFDAHLTKPVNFEAIKEIISTYSAAKNRPAEFHPFPD